MLWLRHVAICVWCTIGLPGFTLGSEVLAMRARYPETFRSDTDIRLLCCNLIDMAFLGHDFCAHWLFAASEGMSPSRSHRRLFPDIRLTDYQYDSTELPMNESRPRPDDYWAPSEPHRSHPL